MLSGFISEEQVSLNFMATVTIQSDFGDQKNKICPSSQSYGFPVVKYGCESCTIKRLSTGQLMLLNCGAGEDS